MKSLQLPQLLMVISAVALASVSVMAQPYAHEDAQELSSRARTTYRIDLSRAASQLITTTIMLEDLSQETVDLRLPTWRPGRYEILDPAGTVRTLHATGPTGAPIDFIKPGKSTWRFNTEGLSRLEVTYTIYANALNNRTRHADSTHAFISPSTVLMYTDERRDEPLTVIVEAPEHWRVSTGLSDDPQGHQGRGFVARDYDTLVDCPLEIGEHDWVTFTVRGVPHEIMIWGRHEADFDRLKSDFAAIVEEQARIFEGDGPLPYGRYVFQIHCGTGLGGGTEHLNSTIMQTRPESFTDDKRYHGFLGLVSHEMFHTWNVKRLRPAGLSPYAYQQENYTELLWVAEGTTSYYDDLTLVRTGLITINDYIDAIRGTISGVLTRPGLHVQSLAASSSDSWIKFNKPTPDSANTTVSFYGQGAVVSMLIDLWIREQSDNAASLDDVMGHLYRNYPLEQGGFTTLHLAEAIDHASGAESGSGEALIERLASGTGDLPLESALMRVGLEVTPQTAAKGSDLGLNLATVDGFASVRSVREGAPAFDAGIIADDLIVSVDGVRTSPEHLNELLNRTAPDTQLQITLFRRGEMHTISLNTASKPVDSWSLSLIKEASDAQQAAFESWIHQPWPHKTKESAPKGDSAESESPNDDDLTSGGDSNSSAVQNQP
jgi:predicted metalloprotease with PDZ domain